MSFPSVDTYAPRSLLECARWSASVADRHPQDPHLLRNLADRVCDPDVARDVYAASAAAIDPSHPAHRIYLQDLADILALPMPVVKALDRAVGATKTPCIPCV